MKKKVKVRKEGNGIRLTLVNKELEQVTERDFHFFFTYLKNTS